MPYSAEQLFALVADVERYPEFLPWCVDCRIKRRIPTSVIPSEAEESKISPLLTVGRDDSCVIYADLTIGYKMFREKFTSKVTMEEPNLVHVEYISGPMKYLSNHWKFITQEDGSCTVDFYVDFEFKNKMLQNIIGMFFTQAMQKMVRAFEARARELYS